MQVNYRIIGDSIDSLTRLHYFGPQALYPGHGRISAAPLQGIDHAIANTQKILAARNGGGPEIFTGIRMRIGSSDLLRMPSSRLFGIARSRVIYQLLRLILASICRQMPSK